MAAKKVPAKMICVVLKEMRELQRRLDGKNSSLRKTYKTESEPNDNVWLLSETRRRKDLPMSATFYERIEAANKDLCDIDNRFDVKFGGEGCRGPERDGPGHGLT